MRWSLVALFLWGCLGKDPAPLRTKPDARTVSAECEAATRHLGGWLQALAAEGREVVRPPSGVTLAAIPASPSPLVPGLVVTVTADDMRVSGASADAAALKQALADARAATPLYVIDVRTPWRAVKAATDAALAAGIPAVVFVFRAEGRSLAAPEPSSIDRPLDEAAAGGPLDGSIPAGVFSRCREASELLSGMVTLGADERFAKVAAELPGAIARCGCDVEVPAVKRLMWAWWGRDAPGAPYTGVTVKLARGGAAVTAPPETPWADAHRALVAAAASGPVKVD
jgi:hypothetical protein